MTTKDLSPAFLTSLASIFVGAILIGLSSSVANVCGWVLLIAGLALNVFSSLVSLQRFKGGPLPSLISEDPEQHPEETFDEPAADTEEQQVISTEQIQQVDQAEEKIFRNRVPRPRNR